MVTCNEAPKSWGGITAEVDEFADYVLDVSA
jgi:hypothetical protein